MKKSKQRSIQSPKPVIVFVSNGITPYGTVFLRRVADELSEYMLRTLYTYEFSMGHWQISLPTAINAKILGKGEEATGRNGIVALSDDWVRYLHLVNEIKESCPVAVIILGYGNIVHTLGN